MARRRLTNATSSPLNRFSCESMTTTERPKTATNICSGCPTILAIFARSGAHTSRATELKKPPKQEASVTRFRARPASPCLTSAFPSSAVGAEAGVPGIPTRTAGIDPPKTPPQYRALKSSSAGPGSMT